MSEAPVLQVRSFAKEGQACGRYSDAQGQCLQWGLKTALLEGFFFAFSGTLAYAAVMSVLWFGARKVGRLFAGYCVLARWSDRLRGAFLAVW